jgi:hypothetical protein
VAVLDLVAAVNRIASRLSGDLARLRAKVLELAEQLRADGLLSTSYCVEPGSISYAGVDGWRGLLGYIAATPVYGVRVVRVEEGKLADTTHDAIYAPGMGEREAEELAMIRMLLVEAELASRSSAKVVVIDGPVVDPPWDPSRRLSVAIARDYHALRASLLSRIVRRGGILIGYAKLFQGYALAKHLGLEGSIGDAELATLILGEVLRNEPNKCYALLGPFRPQQPAIDYYVELDLVTYYVMASWWQSARRVEVPGKQVEAALTSLFGLTPRGLAHPLPVILAHRVATPPRSWLAAARALLAKTTLHLSHG